METLTAPWETVGDQRACRKHGTTFGLLDVCRECIEDPGEAIQPAADIPVETPTGCASVEDLERGHLSIAKQALAHAARLNKKKKKSFHDEVGIAKYLDVAIKARRAAGEIAAARTSKARTAKLLEEKAKSRKRGGH